MIAGANDCLGFRSSKLQRRQQQADQQGHDGNHDQQLSIKTRETQLGMAVEVTTDPQGRVMKAYSEGAALSVSYGDETITIPSRNSDTEIDEFFGACDA